MLEWLKRHAWKACIPQKGIPSSNLGRSAIKTLTVRHNKCRKSAFYLHPEAASGIKKKPKLAEILPKNTTENDACRKVHANCTQLICVRVAKISEIR